jgi:predicted permease
MRSLARAHRANVGIDGLDRILAVGTSFRLAGLPDSVARIKYDQILERIRSIPGVERASAIDNLPLSLGGNSSSTTEIPGYQPGPDENMSILCGRAGADYFQAMGIPVLKGRGFTTTDRSDGDRTIVVNEAFASKYLRGRDPLGIELRFLGEKWTVIGVVGNVARQRVGETPPPYLYLPVARAFADELNFVIRANVAPRTLVEPVRAAIQSVDPNLPVLDPRTMRDNLASVTFAQSIGATLLGVLGAVALGLAAIGLYGVLAFAVAQRNREIGIRIALGAASSRVVGLVLRQASGLVALGVVIGAGLAIGVANLLRAQLFGVQPADPVTFLGVIALLGLVAVAASVLPARRASRVDPVVTLKSE